MHCSIMHILVIFIGMLRLWRNKYGPEATYICLADGFESLKWRHLIIELLDLFCLRSQSKSDQRKKKEVVVPRLG